MYGYGYPNYFTPGQPMPGQLEQLRMAQQPVQMQPMQQEQMTPQSEMPVADMSAPVSEITPTPEDLAGLVEPNRVNAVAGRAAAANEE